MNLTVESSYEYVKVIKIECTPTEALVINHAMRRYACDEDVHESDRKIMERLLAVEPKFVDLPAIPEKETTDRIEYGTDGQPYKYSISTDISEREKETDIEKIREQIREEAEFAYADFEQYKIEVLGVDPETVEDELPNDDFRYGMERAIEIIYENTVAVHERKEASE